MLNPITGEILPNFYGLCRDDNSELLDVVSDGYTPTQNHELTSFISELCGLGNYTWETAGVLGKGETIFVTASTGQMDILGSGDIIKNYILGTNSHNRSMSETYKSVYERVVCANTLAVALSEKSANLRFVHKKNKNVKKRDALRLIQDSQKADLNVKEKLEFLATKKMSVENMTKSISKIFGIETDKDLSKQTANKIQTIKDLFESNDNNAFPLFRGTGYNFLNAITEYTDHFSNVRDTSGNGETEKQRAFSSLFGTGEKFKTESMNVVLELLQNAESTNQMKAYSFIGQNEVMNELLAVKG